MSTSRNPRRLPSRSALVAGLLVLSLALSLVLAYQAVDASRSHQRIAEMTVKDHAYFAAWELSGAIQRDLFSHLLAPGFETVAKAGGANPDLPFEDMVKVKKVASEFGWWRAMEGLDFVFRYNPRQDRFEVLGENTPSDAVVDWVKLQVREQILEAGSGPKKLPWTMAFHGRGENERAVGIALEPLGDGEGWLGFGFQVQPWVLEELIGKIAASVPLLPPTLTKGRKNNEILSFVVHSPLGQELYRSEPQFTSDYSVGEGIGEPFADLGVKVHLLPDMVESMVIGGLPRSRLPVIIGLLALSSGLVIAAIFQIRREQELSLLRTDFVSSVSHQLRTPLAQIRMFGETLLLGRVRSEEERERSLEIIVKESQRLTHQVDNVLLFSRAQRNDVKLNPVETELAPLIRDTLESFCPLAEAQDCRVEAMLEEGLSAVVDPGSVRQILLNLLENAVKYGPNDQIVDVKLLNGKSGMVRLVVEDEGEGIPEDEREAVFTPYSRLDRDRESGVAGSGIGLAVVRELATRQNGAAWAEESMSGGARLVVEFPALPEGEAD